MGSDILYITIWWFEFFVIGVASIPLVWLFFKRFFDVGYGFAKTAGLLLIAYTSFLGATLHLIPFTQATLLTILFLYASLNLYIFRKYRQKLTATLSKNLKTIIFQEILFFLGFIFWSWVRAHQPDIRGLEKFMDFGFINTILNSRYLPPIDMWFAGEPINYYWFGHFIIAAVTKLSGINSSITYNFMLATILGFGLTSSFSLVTTLVKNLSPKTNIKKIVLAGVISAVLLNFGGNFHTPTYILKNGAKKYWYPDATRFIGHNPETEDKTIHEFPMYSYVVSDLHAHLVNLPFVLLFLALLWNLVSTGNLKLEIRNSQNKFVGKIPKLIPLGFVSGTMFMTSAWDFGNYFLVTGVVILTFNIKANKTNLKTFLETARTLASIFTLSALTMLPFLANFASIGQGVKLTHTHSPLWQLVILWGFPAVLSFTFVTILLKFKERLSKPDIFVICLHIASWTLIAIPEFIYLKDIYISSHYRANTMFKLTYQAFVMFYLSSGYIAVRVVSITKKHLEKLCISLGFAITFSVLLIYPYYAVKSYYGELKTYKGLAGDSWVARELPEQNEIINWFKRNMEGQPVILEAPGDSYTDYNVISAYTGLPTVSGWFVHEWLWRGDSSFPQARVNDITEIYTSADIEVTKKLLEKYNVEYVIIDKFAREKFPSVNEEKFSQLGTEVFKFGAAKIYKY